MQAKDEREDTKPFNREIVRSGNVIFGVFPDREVSGPIGMQSFGRLIKDTIPPPPWRVIINQRKRAKRNR